MQALLQDVRYGFRALRKSPSFTAAAIIVLAIGIGANTSIFGVVNGVLLRPLPFEDPDRLVVVWESRAGEGFDIFRVAIGNFVDWKDQNSVFEDMTVLMNAGFTLTGTGDPEQLGGAAVASNYFSVLGVQPMLGRAFLPEEERPGGEPVVIIGHGLWEGRFGADPAIVGRTISMDGSPVTVVGVMPPGLYPTRVPTVAALPLIGGSRQIWVPLVLREEWMTNRRTHVFGVIARLKKDATLDQARADMETIAARLESVSQYNEGETVRVVAFHEQVVGDVRPALLMLLGAVGGVLLIGCANVANLFLARATAREREVAIRAALGAGKARLVRQFLTESMLLALAGGALGSLVGWWGLASVQSFGAANLPRLSEIGVDGAAVGFALGITLLTGVAFGLIPALHAGATRLRASLRDGGIGSTASARRLRFRRVLVVFEVTIAVVVVIGAGLLVKSYWLLNRVDPGFDADGVLTMSVSLPGSVYPEPHDVAGFYNELLGSLAALPGVTSVGAGYDHPLSASWVDAFSIEGKIGPRSGGWPGAQMRIVTAGYFQAAGVLLEKGRILKKSDDLSSPGVVIINDAFARAFFPDENPIGHVLNLPTPSRFYEVSPSAYEIVGVVGDVRFLGPDQPSEPAFYIAFHQFPMSGMVVLVRAEGDPLALANAGQLAVWEIDADQPIGRIDTLANIHAGVTADRRLNMQLLTLFGSIALALAAVGIYGLLAYSVAQRTQEIGVRIALGARGTDVLRLVLRQGMLLVAAGIATGVIGALALARVMGSLLFEVTSRDPWVFASVPLVLAAIALLACYLPATRAGRVDPIVALRSQ